MSKNVDWEWAKLFWFFIQLNQRLVVESAESERSAFAIWLRKKGATPKEIGDNLGLFYREVNRLLSHPTENVDEFVESVAKARRTIRQNG